MSSAPICITCGAQYPEGPNPEHCLICTDERQYVGWNGQLWTTLDELRRTHRNEIRCEEPGLYSLRTAPEFAINQRCFVVQTPEGNLLWDCVALLDDGATELIRSLGGLRGIAVSHPHYHASMVEWSRAFGDAPIWIHERDRQWVMRPERCVRFWKGEHLELFGGLKLVWTGGHFDGFQVLHWPAGADGRGALLAGDQPQVAMDRRWVSFLWSYPNMVPLGGAAVRSVAARLEPLAFDRLYGAFAGRTVAAGAKEVIARSAERYLRMIAR